MSRESLFIYIVSRLMVAIPPRCQQFFSSMVSRVFSLTGVDIAQDRR